MSDTAIDIRAVLGLLHRRLRLIVFTVVGCLAVAVLVLAVTPPSYTASALLMVEPDGRAVFGPESAAGGMDDARVASAVEVLRSDAVLRTVVASQDLARDRAFGAAAGWRQTLGGLVGTARGEARSGAASQRALDTLRAATAVRRLGATHVIATTVEAADPDRAATLANAISNAFIRQQLQGKIDRTLSARQAIDARIEAARTAIIEAEEAFDMGLARVADQLDSQEVPGLAALGEELEAAMRERDSLRQQLLAERSGAGGGVRDGATRLVAAAVEPGVDVTPLGDRVAALSARVEDLRAQLRLAVLSSDLPPTVTAELYELQQTADLARSQHRTLLERSSELRMNAGLQMADSHLVSPALAPMTPSGPNAPLTLALAGLAGVSMGLGLAVAAESYVGGFTSREQLATGLKVRAAVDLPRQREVPEGALQLPDMMNVAPLSLYAESVRRLRAALDRMIAVRSGAAPSATGSVIMVSSAEPGEGKTTTALSLARAYALSGRKTLLVDCDLRQPGVHACLGLTPTTGLLDFLEGRRGEALSQMIALDSATGLSVLTGVRPAETPTDQIVSGAALAELLVAARRRFEVVILDTPPAGSVVDPFYIAGNADAVAFVVQWAATGQGSARAALTDLTSGMTDADKVVAVLNRHESLGRTDRDPYAGYYARSRSRAFPS